MRVSEKKERTLEGGGGEGKGGEGGGGGVGGGGGLWEERRVVARGVRLSSTPRAAGDLRTPS